MNRLHLGEFEELILLTVGILYDDAYAVAITKEIVRQCGRDINIGAVHKTLYRLEDKGMLRSVLSDPEAKRGGKRKRLFTMTAFGKKALEDSLALRMSMLGQIPDIAINQS